MNIILSTIHMKNILDSYITRNYFNNGINDGDCIVICNGGSFIVHSSVVSATSKYIDELIKYQLITSDKIEIHLDFPLKTTMKFFGWLYDTTTPLESYKVDCYSEYFNYFKIIDKLELDDKYSITINNYYQWLKKRLSTSKCIKKEWAILIYFLENYKNKYFDLLRQDIMKIAHNEIKNEVISYTLDLFHSEYLADNKHKIDKFSTFLIDPKYPLSIDTKYEIIIKILVEKNQDKSR